jgi:hypothetical protein
MSKEDEYGDIAFLSFPFSHLFSFHVHQQLKKGVEENETSFKSASNM